MSLLKLSSVALLMLLGSSELMSSTLEVEVKKTNEWDGGFCSNVYVSNSSDISQKWDISFDAGGLITKLWSAEYHQDKETLRATASGLSWNDTIDPNERVKFGYCADTVELKPLPPKEGELVVSESLKEAWDGGFCNRVEVLNITNHPIDWEVSFVVKGEVTSTWNSNYTQNSETLKLTTNGVTWNNIIDPNETVSYGYCANNIDEDKTDGGTDTPDNNTSTSALALFNEFNVGFGGASAIPFVSNTADEKIWVSSVNLVLDENIETNDYYNGIKNFDAAAFDSLQKSLSNSKFLVYWITEGWEESWFSLTKIQKAMDAGFVPVFNYWYFGDKLDGVPSSTEQEAYVRDNQRVTEFLNKLNGTKFLIMEPEFNKHEIISSESNQHQFASILGSAIDRIKANSSDIYFSLAMTDTGSRGESTLRESCAYETCALGDKNAWGKPSIVYNELLDKLDFISFQEMVAQFSRDYENSGTWDNPIPRANTDEGTGINYFAQRVANFSAYLKEKYNKPVFLSYIGLATATWHDANANKSIESSELDYNGWEEQVNSAYRDLSLMKSELQEKGLFGFAVMSLFDNPQHDEGGYQYFMQNEYHLGIIKSGAVDSTDIASHGDIQPKGNIVNNIFNSL
jgi:hypothetical protein